MKNQDHLAQDEMRKLIKKSCSFVQNKDANPYYLFQKSLLKFFFQAADVTIDFDNFSILLWTSKERDEIRQDFYRLKEAIAVRISYTDLEETLKGCLENGSNQTRFYKSLLFHYNQVAQDLEHNVKSA